MTRFPKGTSSLLEKAPGSTEGKLNYETIYASLNMNIPLKIMLNASCAAFRQSQHATACDGERAPCPYPREATTSRRLNPLSPKQDE
ncbi:hypothetical protein E2C01_038167 [Portunus trituberculatus]|uniref:Uncharacterized protein n=1 Tax=Portunus trituberculatus TaxID=210409 RepID=A0A5B7FJ78_PORTR|nr:hypothetical protein [Portunus trituberculatus]